MSTASRREDRRLAEYERLARRDPIPRGHRATQREIRRAIRQETLDARDAFPPRKEQAECCMAEMDELGRPPLGFCSPECIRRPGNWKLVLAGEPIPEGGVPTRRSHDDKRGAA